MAGRTLTPCPLPTGLRPGGQGALLPSEEAEGPGLRRQPAEAEEESGRRGTAGESPPPWIPGSSSSPSPVEPQWGCQMFAFNTSSEHTRTWWPLIQQHIHRVGPRLLWGGEFLPVPAHTHPPTFFPAGPGPEELGCQGRGAVSGPQSQTPCSPELSAGSLPEIAGKEGWHPCHVQDGGCGWLQLWTPAPRWTAGPMDLP